MAVATALALGALVGSAGPALAHGDTGEIEVGDAEVVDALTVEFPVRITYTGDGHAAEEVEGLVVSGKGPDGATLPPTDAFTPGDAPGVYIARVELPSEGTWDLLIEVAQPAATATLTADAGAAVVAPADEPDAEPPVGAAPPGDPDDPAVADDAPADADDGSDGAGEDGAGEDTGAGGDTGDDTAADEDDDSDSGAVLLVAAIVVILVVVVAAVVVSGRRSSSS